MSRDEILAGVLRVLVEIAPEADPETLRRDIPLRDQVDIDSMDFLNLIVGIGVELQMDVPESAYDQLQTLDEIVAFVAARAPR